MSNPKTTLIGGLVILGAVVKVLTDYFQTGTVSATDVNALLIALAGVGHIFAKDGGK